jgi:hypothetical protein
MWAFGFVEVSVGFCGVGLYGCIRETWQVYLREVGLFSIRSLLLILYVCVWALFGTYIGWCGDVRKYLCCSAADAERGFSVLWKTLLVTLVFFLWVGWVLYPIWMFVSYSLTFNVDYCCGGRRGWGWRVTWLRCGESVVFVEWCQRSYWERLFGCHWGGYWMPFRCGCRIVLKGWSLGIFLCCMISMIAQI